MEKRVKVEIPAEESKRHINTLADLITTVRLSGNSKIVEKKLGKAGILSRPSTRVFNK